MAAIQLFVAQDQMKAVHQRFSDELCPPLERLRSRLSSMSKDVRNLSPWHYSELREAKSIISCFKYPDTTAQVRIDEMAWALKRVIESYRTDAKEPAPAVFEGIAAMLHIDLMQSHPVPQDLSRRISNELALLNRNQRSEPLATAV